MSRTTAGRFFEDLTLGEEIHHATPRTVTPGDAALYLALTGSRFGIHCSDTLARMAGLPRPPLEDLLTFHLVFGRSVPDVSRNAVANLGYADGRFGALLYPGDTFHAISEVIGLRESSNGRTGVVWLRTKGVKEDGRQLLEYVRWVLVNKRDPASPAPTPVVPDLPDHVAPEHVMVPAGLRPRHFDRVLSGAMERFDSYALGERIDHVDGMTIDEAEHRMATRLYQNPAAVHFNAHREKSGRFGRCIVYGGHVLSIARALSFNGLGNVLHVAAINAGSHANPTFAGDTIYAWSEILDKADLPRHPDLGALRLRLVATKDRPCDDFPYRDAAGKYLPEVVLDFDYWGIVPR
jgi:2-methylfumaryl-CoA hydratase